MLCVAQRTPLSSRDQKVKTWKFAAKFLWKNRFVENKQELGKWTKTELLNLGPTFVKLGQIASTRSDIYPVAFTTELESLQDDVPPVDFSSISSIIDVGVFSSFDEKPFKSASIGQVHKATLKDGKEVIVKVKRPDIYNIMKADTDNIRDIVHFLERIGVDTGNSSGIVLNESIDYLLGEADYTQELENAIRFRKGLKDVKWIKVPKVYTEYSNENMIVMEYVESEKITDIQTPGVNNKKVCEALINSYIIQTMDKGFFHADPHPGNIGFSKKGRLVFYDFGLIISLSEELREGFKKLFVHIINKDTKKIVEVLVALRVIIPTTTDVTDIEVFFESILGYLETLDASNIMNDDLAIQLAAEKPFVVPSSFIYLAKAFSIIEGICVKLDPNFNYFTYLEPMIKEQFAESINVREILASTSEIPSRIRNISKAVLDLEKSKTAMRRSIKKTRREIRFAQFSILSAMLSQQFEETPLALLFFVCTIWFTFSSQRNKL
ncbi:putative ABC-1 domain protein [Dishui Lake phycodnavirus 3]|nr:putative ABC-1 domain protein [Dishui Lake phycodnavirus 3]